MTADVQAPAARKPPSSGRAIIEWTARIRSNMHELGGSYSVFIFLSDVPANPDKWHSEPSYVGTFYAYADAMADLHDPDKDIQGFVHLNKQLLKRSGQKSLDPSIIVPYLTDHLHWAVQKSDRSAADMGELPSLEVVVIGTPLMLDENARFPIAGDPVEYRKITYGRPGGSRHE